MADYTSEIKPEALAEFGEGLHTATDRTSPAHTDENGDPKVNFAYPTGSFGVVWSASYNLEEDECDEACVEEGAGIAREEFEKTFGEAATKEATEEPKEKE